MGLILTLTFLIFAFCMLAMAVGVIFRNKTFTSCGNASIDFHGERIDCPACERRESCRKRECEKEP